MRGFPVPLVRFFITYVMIVRSFYCIQLQCSTVKPILRRPNLDIYIFSGILSYLKIKCCRLSLKMSQIMVTAIFVDHCFVDRNSMFYSIPVVNTLIVCTLECILMTKCSSI